MSHSSLFQTSHAIQNFSLSFTRSSMLIHFKEYQVRLFYPALIARRSAGLEAKSDHNKRSFQRTPASYHNTFVAHSRSHSATSSRLGHPSHTFSISFLKFYSMYISHLFPTLHRCRDTNLSRFIARATRFLGFLSPTPTLSALNTPARRVIKPVFRFYPAPSSSLEANFRPHQGGKRFPQNIRFLCIRHDIPLAILTHFQDTCLSSPVR